VRDFQSSPLTIVLMSIVGLSNYPPVSIKPQGIVAVHKLLDRGQSLVTADVADGSFSDFDARSHQVRSAPNNRHRQAIPTCPFRANNRLMHRSNYVLFAHRVGGRGERGLIRAAPLSADPQSATSRLTARPERST
jgi:hypothetical protein